MPLQNNGKIEAQIIFDFHENGMATIRFGGIRKLNLNEFEVVASWLEQHVDVLLGEDQEPIQ